MKVTVQQALREPRCPLPDEAAFRRWAMAIDAGRREVCVRIVDNQEARALNRRYRQQSYLPNVLAFPFTSPLAATRDYLGDVVMAARQVVAEARERRLEVDHHWAHLFVHGVLHLQGYDHQSPEQARCMQAKEISILKKLDLASPYAGATASLP